MASFLPVRTTKLGMAHAQQSRHARNEHDSVERNSTPSYRCRCCCVAEHLHTLLHVLTAVVGTLTLEAKHAATGLRVLSQPRPTVPDPYRPFPTYTDRSPLIPTVPHAHRPLPPPQPPPPPLPPPLNTPLVHRVPALVASGLHSES